ncbi:MAG: helix-turn-helix domain-containing protein [Clostridia bacterium]|nr:helix-turn-helix domain-containing protein [Clostridia bacterium]
MSTFGERLKSQRRENGYSQTDLSERIGVSVQSISKWENDNAMPDISQIVPLSAVLGVSTDWLLGVGMNEEHDKALLEKRIAQISVQKSFNTYADNADYLIYEIQREFLKKYPLNYTVRLECAQRLYSYLQKCIQLNFGMPENDFTDKCHTGVKMLRALVAQDKDPSHQIDGRKLLINFLKLLKSWDEAEQIAMELPETYEIRYEALLDIACEKKDYETAESLALNVSKKRAYEYLNSLFLRARRISIYGTARKKEAIVAWRQMVDEAKDVARIYGGEILDFNEIIDQFLIEAITRESNDHLVNSDIPSALDCVEEATDIIERAFERYKKSGATKENLEKYVADCRWIPIKCYGWVIADDDNVLSREPRFKACQERIEHLA